MLLGSGQQVSTNNGEKDKERGSRLNRERLSCLRLSILETPANDVSLSECHRRRLAAVSPHHTYRDERVSDRDYR